MAKKLGTNTAVQTTTALPDGVHRRVTRDFLRELRVAKATIEQLRRTVNAANAEDARLKIAMVRLMGGTHARQRT